MCSTHARGLNCALRTAPNCICVQFIRYIGRAPPTYSPRSFHPSEFGALQLALSPSLIPPSFPLSLLPPPLIRSTNWSELSDARGCEQKALSAETAHYSTLRCFLPLAGWQHKEYAAIGEHRKGCRPPPPQHGKLS